MSNNIQDGGPAFPVNEVFDERRGEAVQYGSAGMSLRDYFAAKALSGIASDGMLTGAATENDCDLLIQNAAVLSYKLADAMIAARAA